MADDRLFRLTYDSGTIKYGPRVVVGPAAAYTLKHKGSWSYRVGMLTKVEATDMEATSGWADVTEEFLGADATARAEAKARNQREASERAREHANRCPNCGTSSVVGRAIEHSIKDPFTGETSARMVF
jgi:hypothetical protein